MSVIQEQYNDYVNMTPPAAIVNNASFTVAALDTLGFNQAAVVLTLGALDIALSALSLTESDDNSTYTAVAGTDFSVLPLTLPSATDDNHIFVFHVNLRGNRKRYLKPTVTMGSGSTGGYATVLGILTLGEIGYKTASKRGITQEVFV